MTSPIFTIVLALISGGLGTWIIQYFGKKKTAAETEEIRVKAEVLLSQEAREFAKQLRTDNEALRLEFQQKLEDNRTYYTSIIDGLKLALKALEDKYQIMVKENAELETARNLREEKLNECFDNMIDMKEKMAAFQAQKEVKLDEAKETIKNTVDTKLEEVKVDKLPNILTDNKTP